MARTFRVFLEEEDVTPSWWTLCPLSVAEFDCVVSHAVFTNLSFLHESMFGARPKDVVLPRSWVTDNYVNQCIRGVISSQFVNFVISWRDIPYALVGMLTLRIVEEA